MVVCLRAGSSTIQTFGSLETIHTVHAPLESDCGARSTSTYYVVVLVVMVVVVVVVAVVVVG